MGPRAEKGESGSGIVGSLLGLLFVLVFMIAAARLAGLAMLDQRLNALASDSARRLAMGGASASPFSVSTVERHVREMLPGYGQDLSFQVTKATTMLTFEIELNHYSMSVWPGLSSGPYQLKASATSHLESSQ